MGSKASKVSGSAAATEGRESRLSARMSHPGSPRARAGFLYVREFAQRVVAIGILAWRVAADMRSKSVRAAGRGKTTVTPN